MARYLLFHKPFQVLSVFTDPTGRATLSRYVPVPGVYAAGRLDYDSEGLLLLTDDGPLIHWLTHPRHELPKTYAVLLEGQVTGAALEKLRRGVPLQGRVTRPARVERIDTPELPPRAVRDYHPTTWLQIELREGRKRQIRRMTAAVGYPTLRLVRVAIGPLRLDGLPPGHWRHLSPAEVRALADLSGLDLAPDQRA